MVTTRSSGTQPDEASSLETMSTRKRTSPDHVGGAAPKRAKLPAKTDRSRWRMLDDEGRHTWHYLEDDEKAKEWPQSYADKWYLGLPLVGSPPFAAASSDRSWKS